MTFGLTLTVQTKESSHKASDVFDVLFTLSSAQRKAGSPVKYVTGWQTPQVTIHSQVISFENGQISLRYFSVLLETPIQQFPLFPSYFTVSPPCATANIW